VKNYFLVFLGGFGVLAKSFTKFLKSFRLTGVCSWESSSFRFLALVGLFFFILIIKRFNSDSYFYSSWW
jgi:hypothetical protein